MRLPIVIVVFASLLCHAGCSPIPPRDTSDGELGAPLPDADDADLFAYRPHARQPISRHQFSCRNGERDFLDQLFVEGHLTV